MQHTTATTWPERVRAAIAQIRSMVSVADSLAALKLAIERSAPDLLAPLGADALVISVSAAGGYIIGGGAGMELLYGPALGWACYGQYGIGLASPGGGAAIEVGFVWDIKDPGDYEGFFVEAAITAGPGAVGAAPGMLSLSGSMTPHDLLGLASFGRIKQKNPRALKRGLGYGTPGVSGSVLVEYYEQMAAQSSCWGLLQRSNAR